MTHSNNLIFLAFFVILSVAVGTAKEITVKVKMENGNDYKLIGEFKYKLSDNAFTFVIDELKGKIQRDPRIGFSIGKEPNFHDVDYDDFKDGMTMIFGCGKYDGNCINLNIVYKEKTRKIVIGEKADLAKLWRDINFAFQIEGFLVRRFTQTREERGAILLLKKGEESIALGQGPNARLNLIGIQNGATLEVIHNDVFIHSPPSTIPNQAHPKAIPTKEGAKFQYDFCERSEPCINATVNVAGNPNYYRIKINKIEERYMNDIPQLAAAIQKLFGVDMAEKALIRIVRKSKTETKSYPFWFGVVRYHHGKLEEDNVTFEIVDREPFLFFDEANKK